MLKVDASSVRINPRAAELGKRNAILWGRGRNQYHVREFAGPLSIKSVIRGSAEWSVGRSRFPVDVSSFLVLNPGQPYSLTVDAKLPVETFCVFFKSGFVEDASRSLTSTHEHLLDGPFGDRLPAAGFYERLWSRDTRITPVLEQLHQALLAGEVDAEGWDDIFVQLAFRLNGLRSEERREMARLPGVRPATRYELFRRVHDGKDEWMKIRPIRWRWNKLRARRASHRFTFTGCSRRCLEKRRMTIEWGGEWNTPRGCCGRSAIR